MAATGKQTGAHERSNAPPDLVRAQLDRILASSSFSQAESLIRLLRYLVEEALAGRSDRLKEYTLGEIVFQRGADFDPRVDTIVRTQARRLRAKLHDYYSGQGRPDPILIDLPKGTYVPVFLQRSEPEQPPRGRVPLGRAMSVLAAAAAVIALTVAITGQRSIADGRQSVAVLPFADLSLGSSQTNLADGMSEEVSQALAGMSGLRVASRISTLQYKGRGEDVRKIGASLGVTAVVEGSVRSLGDRIRITAHLVNSRDGYRFWSRTWEVLPAGVGRAHTDIAEAIAGALKVASALSQPNPEAYRLYLKGRFQPKAAESLAFIDQALRVDPRFSAAWMAKAEFYMSQTWMANAPPSSVLPRAREAAQRAIELGHDVPQAHMILANVAATHDWNWDQAEREHLRALELDPHGSWPRLRYAQLLVLRGRTGEAIEQVQRIGALEPAATPLASGQAAIYYLAREYDRAIEHCKAVLDATPHSPDCHFWMGRAYLSKGMPAEAVASLEKRHLAPGQGFGSLATAYLAAGRRSEAWRLRSEVERRAAHSYVSPVSLAQMYFAFGEPDAGFRALDRALDLKDQSLPSLKVEPAYDSIRSDPRFQRVLRKIRL